jgi:hypothetical protein
MSLIQSRLARFPNCFISGSSVKGVVTVDYFLEIGKSEFKYDGKSITKVFIKRGNVSKELHERLFPLKRYQTYYFLLFSSKYGLLILLLGEFEYFMEVIFV